ncbi:hypothetical protein G6F37_000890 [Rhizopus arrhizus]|nr:hypothetical protein G6F38_000329 [Rhizopus arrhizus]KAG1163789.1 hypothetical protein G6F37_000890 [Rhizopus arrhizus]
MTQLNWLNVQLQHHARASILREVYYKNQEVSLEELRIKYNPAKSIIKKWRSQEPIVLKPYLIQEQQSTKRSIQEQHVFSLQPHDQPVKRGQKHIKERILKQQQQQQQRTVFQASQIQKQQQQTKLSQPQKVLKKPTLGKTLLFATETPAAAAVSQIESAHPPVESKQKDIMVTREEGVVELPHSPEFVHDQINKSGARVCSTYHIIKESASNTQKMLSSWFVYDKKKRLWKPSTKKEKHSLVHLLESEFLVVSKLGEGGMAQVFLVQETDSLAFYGLKVQQPPNPWEFYIHYQINERKKQNKTPFHLLPVLNYYYYNDTSFLLMPYIRHGTLLDAYNRYIAAQKTMPEPIIALFTARFIQQLILLHSLDICHNDLKLDNVMLISRRKDTMPDVVLIDFGHSIDVRVLDYPQCKASWPPACPLSGYPQFNTGYNPIHADYWELAAMSHRLLFGEPMQAICTHEGKFTIQQKFKRYWHVSLWSMLFECLLNRSNEQTDINLLLQEFDKIQVHDKLIHECIQVLTK